MNKKQQKELQDKIASVEETVKVLKLQETNLLEVIRLHDEYDPQHHQWVGELIIGAGYIVRLEHSIKTMKDLLKPRRPRGGKKKD